MDFTYKNDKIILYELCELLWDLDGNGRRSNSLGLSADLCTWTWKICVKFYNRVINKLFCCECECECMHVILSFQVVWKRSDMIQLLAPFLFTRGGYLYLPSTSFETQVQGSPFLGQWGASFLPDWLSRPSATFCQ